MRIRDLINGNFSFNFPFRILEYVGMDDDPDKTITVYESKWETEIPADVQNRWISAVNEGDDGVMEIEFIRLIGED